MHYFFLSFFLSLSLFLSLLSLSLSQEATTYRTQTSIRVLPPKVPVPPSSPTGIYTKL